MLISKVHGLYERLVRRAPSPPVDAVVAAPVSDSPSERITRPMAAVDEDLAAGDLSGADDSNDIGLDTGHKAAAMTAFEHDESDREDGENWMESSLERALEQLPAEQPLVIDDEPPRRHDH